ncbi:thioredoxin domain-containing protein [Compostibacter hankyongensis]|uniref:Thioredoxin domain-containing protein n=1 Tax=Compostibacter hankyongensis TaxID=1007089 RepID=A0ABP8FDV8_9BACT
MKTANRLIHESSPYLQQHARNPVDWYPWGPEALQRAKEEDKPILVSIGYAACHWCHVMERESFEDEATARLMNDHFVNIKIDREERPDLDHIYMDAVQALTGAGGWPLNVFLTPAGAPFFGGTYFPPVNAYGRASWREVLAATAAAYRDKREEVLEQAQQLTGWLRNAAAAGAGGTEIPSGILDTMARELLKQADTREGGFGAAPKFPSTMALQYLLRYHSATGNEAALEQVLLSLDKMSAGGLYDQVGGGFARYATDARWKVPHFEKMLYDNALLVETLSEACQLTGKEAYARTLRQTMDYITREMTGPDGGFYASQDADSEGEEGKYYLWDKAEIEKALGADAAWFCRLFQVTDEGNWEGRNILYRTVSTAEFARQQGWPEPELLERLEKALAQLLAIRLQREKPLLDNKQLLGWNALMTAACCKAYAALGEEAWLQMALRNAAFVRQRLRDPAQTGALLHSDKSHSPHPAFLDDYAFYIRALLLLQETTGDTTCLEEAAGYAEHVLQHFGDEEGLYFYYTAEGQQDVIVRKKDQYDGPVPSGNAVMADNLLRLGLLLERPDFGQRARRMLEGMAPTVMRYPSSFGAWAGVIWSVVQGIAEVAVVGPAYRERLKEILPRWFPARVMMAAAGPDERYPLLRDREGPGTLLYLCRDYTCLQPVKTAAELWELLERGRFLAKD